MMVQPGSVAVGPFYVSLHPWSAAGYERDGAGLMVQVPQRSGDQGLIRINQVWLAELEMLRCGVVRTVHLWHDLELRGESVMFQMGPVRSPDGYFCACFHYSVGDSDLMDASAMLRASPDVVMANLLIGHDGKRFG